MEASKIDQLFVQGSVSTLTDTTNTVGDFDTFLRMLTAQAKYQDPLDPVKGSDYAAQLAQFSMVEQQVLSNDLLLSLSKNESGGALAAVSTWIGLSAQVSGPVAFDGVPVPVQFTSHPGADQIWLVARNASGEEVARDVIAPSSDSHSWLGLNPEGKSLPEGRYTLTVESHIGGKVVTSNSVNSGAVVIGFRIGDTGITIELDNGQEVDETQIVALSKSKAQ